MSRLAPVETKKFAIAGIIGTVIAIVGNFFFDYLGGRETQELGAYRMIQSAWGSMPRWRMTLSLCLMTIAVPLMLLGLYAMKQQLAPLSKRRANIVFGVGSVGILGALLSRGVFAMLPLAYRTILETGNSRLAEQVVDSMIYSYYPIYFALYFLLYLLFPLLIFFAIVRKKTPYSPWCALVAAFPLLSMGNVLGSFYPAAFDWLRVIVPSLDILAMFVFALLYDQTYHDIAKRGKRI